MALKDTTPFDFYQEDTVDIKAEISKYLRFWPWFVLGLLIALFSAYVYLRYAPKIYQSTAKIKILDESEGLELPTSAFVFKRTNINLENEREILTSYIILERVVRQLKLNTSFYEEGNVQTSQRAELPVFFEQLVSPDSIDKDSSYKVVFNTDGFEVENLDTEQVMTFPGHTTYTKAHSLPFQLKALDDSQLEEAIGKTYLMVFTTVKKATLGLKGQIEIEPIGDQSDLLQLNLKGESPERSEAILNTLIDVFNQDGINDRQLVSRRTMDFIDERFLLLASDLDSIEISRQQFKQDNNLVEFEVDAQLGIEQRTQSDARVFEIENQLTLAKLIQDALQPQKEPSLLPANFGLESSSINGLIGDYNQLFLEREKLMASGGVNNPAVNLLSGQLSSLSQNINRSLQSYITQLQASKQQIQSRNQRFVGQVAELPEKEKLLRAIERQQKIKESLYLLLLQKREEAAINYAITEPSIKVVENALSGIFPVSPKRNIVYAAALLAGLLVPFGILYVLFLLDTKVHGKKDIEDLQADVPLAAEIPKIEPKKSPIFSNPNDRTALAEAFRILSSNVKYMLPQGETGQVIYCTSAIKGEGKTFVSLNVSLALSSLNKKVLLIGADMRNPQLHAYLNLDKNQAGLSNYLHDTRLVWKDLLFKGFEKHPNHDMLLSGELPPNPAHLLTNGRFEALLEEAKQQYDYIVVDTAPTILVTDTLLISQFADATLYITRANFTEKKLLEHSMELYNHKKLKNMAYVINAIGSSNRSYGYNYGYDYGYGSGE